MKTENIPLKYISRFGAADLLKVSVKTIDRLIRDSRIKAFKLNSRVIIEFDSITEENINSPKPKFKNFR